MRISDNERCCADPARWRNLAQLDLYPLLTLRRPAFRSHAAFKSFGSLTRAGQRSLLRHVYLPAAESWILSSLRASVGFAIIGAIIGEYLGSPMPKGLPFSEGTVVAKFLTTTAGPDCVPFLRGAPEVLERSHGLISQLNGSLPTLTRQLTEAADDLDELLASGFVGGRRLAGSGRSAPVRCPGPGLGAGQQQGVPV